MEKQDIVVEITPSLLREIADAWDDAHLDTKSNENTISTVFKVGVERVALKWNPKMDAEGNLLNP